MPNWNGLVLTKKGQLLQAKVGTGVVLALTKMKLGSGVLPNGTSLEDLTDLVTPEQNVGIASKEVLTDQKMCKISATITNVGLSAGYYVRELGVFANDPDDGEILYAVTSDSAPDYLPPEGGSTAVSQEFAVYISASNASDVEVSIDPGALATMGYVETAITAYNSLETAHPNLDFVTQLNAAADGLHYRTRNGKSEQVIDLINQLQATLSQGTVPSGNTGTLAALLSGIVHQIAALSGKSNWWDTPKTNFETLSAGDITGILPVAHGGTGTDSLANVTVGKAGTLVGDAGLWDYLHRLGKNPTLPTTNDALNALGVFISYFDQSNKIANQPTQYGQLINIPALKKGESTQLWIEQSSGRMYHRGGNYETAINNTPFKRFLDTDDLSAAGVVAGNVSNANAWWVKLGGAVPLIIQGGFSSSGTFTYPISISTFLTGGTTTRMSSRNYDSDWGEIIGAPTSSYFRFRQNGYSDGTYCWLIGR
nr:MAG TPA: tail collar fiber protein [Caudoviricetes sp.]